MRPGPRRVLLHVLLSITASLTIFGSDGTGGASSPWREAKLPSWVTLGGQIRTRFEMPLNARYEPGQQDGYIGNRLRFNIKVQPASWFKVFAEAQDVRVFGYDSGSRPGSLHNPLDLHQAWMEIGGAEQSRLSLKVGRQELKYAGGYLFSSADWAINARVYDAAVLSTTVAGWKGDFVAGGVVLADASRPDRRHAGEQFFGTDWQKTKSIPAATLELFAFARKQAGVVSERGAAGDALTWSSGARVTGKVIPSVDYSVLFVRQFGTWSADRTSSWAGIYSAGWTIAGARWKPRMSAEYDAASGDHNQRDGTRQAFEGLYGAYHYFLGEADRLGWRNARSVRAGVDFVPAKNWKVLIDVRDLSLMTVTDGLYSATFAREALNRLADSRHVGMEGDISFMWTVNARTKLAGGIGHIFPGRYLMQSTPGGHYTFPYVMISRQF